jgi:hypothetical protein
MIRRRQSLPRIARWSFFAVLLGTTFGEVTSCSDATQAALISGARNFSGVLLDTFFDNIVAGSNSSPVVTVKSIVD